MDTGRSLATINAANVQKFSGSTSGKGIQIAATSTPGTAIHTAVAGAVSFSRMFIYFTNTSASSIVVTVEWGGTGTANNIVYTVPGNNTGLVVPGLMIQGGLSVAAFAATGSVLNAIGWVELVY